MPNRLAHKVALITGAGAGTGRATALLFAQERAKVVVQDLNAAAAQEMLDLIKRAGGEAVGIGGDVTFSANAQAMADMAVHTYSRLDVLFNNASIWRGGPSSTSAKTTRIVPWPSISKASIRCRATPYHR